ncbi:MAG: ATP-binding protein [Pseudomonadota bacterium]
MRKLYLRVVLAIWGVMLISSVSAVVVLRASTPDDSLWPPFPDDMGRMIFESAIERIPAQAGVPGKRIDALIDWMRSDPLVRRRFDMRLTNAAGEELFRFARSRRPADEDTVEQSVFNFTVEGEDYRLHTAATREQVAYRESRRAIARVLFRAEFPLLAILIAVPLSILISLRLARYLVQPLREFEQASDRLSEGDFSVRVTPRLGRRADEIAEFAATFDAMAVRIDALVRSHKDLLRDVSHELRSPLARLMAALSLARQRQGEAALPELSTIEQEVERLDRLIERLLTYARLDARHSSAPRQLLDLDELVIGTMADAAGEAQAAGVTMHLSGVSPCPVLGDRELLVSAIENVLRNALSYSPASGVVRLRLAASEEGASWVLSLEDQGPGVAEDQLALIFEPFYRAEGEDEGDAREGYGIGLAIARSAVAAHGGRIEAYRAALGGLGVSITLPMAQEEHTGEPLESFELTQGAPAGAHDHAVGH